MPLLAKENLAKNSKILIPQIKEHFEKLKKYHKDNNMIIPQKFIKLYAKHLVAGNPLELKLPPFTRNCKQGTRLIAETNGNNVKELDNPQCYFLTSLGRLWRALRD
jgi:hypothetical protein